MRLFVFSFLASLMLICVLAAEPVQKIEMPEYTISVKIPHNTQLALVNDVSASDVYVDDSAMFAKKANSETSRLVKLCVCLVIAASLFAGVYFFLAIRFSRAVFGDKRNQVQEMDDQ